MKIINSSYEILTPLNEMEVLKRLEVAGRVCYKSEDKITDKPCLSFVNLIKSKNHLMENGCATEVTILDTELDRLRRENAAMKGLLKLLIDAKIKPAEPVISLYPSYHTAQFARSVAYDDLDLERCENFLRRKNENG